MQERSPHTTTHQHASVFILWTTGVIAFIWKSCFVISDEHHRTRFPHNNLKLSGNLCVSEGQRWPHRLLALSVGSLSCWRRSQEIKTWIHFLLYEQENNTISTGIPRKSMKQQFSFILGRSLQFSKIFVQPECPNMYYGATRLWSDSPSFSKYSRSQCSRIPECSCPSLDFEVLILHRSERERPGLRCASQ